LALPSPFYLVRLRTLARHRSRRRGARDVAVTPAAAEQLLTPAKHGRPVAEHFRALALAPVADPTPHDAQAELPEERAALGQAVDAKAVLRRVDQPQFEILESVDVA